MGKVLRLRAKKKRSETGEIERVLHIAFIGKTERIVSIEERNGLKISRVMAAAVAAVMFFGLFFFTGFGVFDFGAENSSAIDIGGGVSGGADVGDEKTVVNFRIKREDGKITVTEPLVIGAEFCIVDAKDRNEDGEIAEGVILEWRTNPVFDRVDDTKNYWVLIRLEGAAKSEYELDKTEIYSPAKENDIMIWVIVAVIIALAFTIWFVATKGRGRSKQGPMAMMPVGPTVPMPGFTAPNLPKAPGLKKPAQKGAAAPKKAEKTDLKSTELKKGGLKKSDNKKADVKQADIKKADIQKTDLKKAGAQKADVKQADIKKADIQKTDLKKTGIQKADIKKVEVKKAEAKKTDIQKVDVKKTEPTKSEFKKGEKTKVEVKKVEPTKSELKKGEKAKMEAKKVEPSKAELKKAEKAKAKAEAEAKKAEKARAKAEAKKVEPTKKAEKAKADNEKVDAKKIKPNKKDLKKSEPVAVAAPSAPAATATPPAVTVSNVSVSNVSVSNASASVKMTGAQFMQAKPVLVQKETVPMFEMKLVKNSTQCYCGSAELEKQMVRMDKKDGE
jgi:hypothetical protein